VTCKRLALWVLVFAVQTPCTALATGLGPVLANSPFADFTDADYEQFFASAKLAADGPVGAANVEWSNAATKARGTVQSTRAFQRQEGDCRELRGENTARGRTQPFRVTVCKGANGQWLLAPSDRAQTATPPAAAVSPGFPTTLPASFSGVLPCADCPGLKYLLEFHDDGNYRLRTTYLGRGDGGEGESVEDAGAWQLVAPDNRRVTLRSDRNTTLSFAIKDADTLRLLDAGGREFKTSRNYELKRDAAYASIPAANK
jgi:surface antigen